MFKNDYALTNVEVWPPHRVRTYVVWGCRGVESTRLGKSPMPIDSHRGIAYAADLPRKITYSDTKATYSHMQFPYYYQLAYAKIHLNITCRRGPIICANIANTETSIIG